MIKNELIKKLKIINYLAILTVQIKSVIYL